MRQTALAILSQRLSLEAVLTTPDDFSAPFPAVVLCNPHPALSGNMEHPLLQTVANALDQAGMATLRFNYRGVGASEGEFSNGEHEAKDVRAALRLVRAWPQIDNRRVAILGYSFGASVILQSRESLKEAWSFVFISPPLSALTNSRTMRYRCPKLILVGDADRIAPASRLQEMVATFSTVGELEVVPNANHSWYGFEGKAAGWATRFLVNRMKDAN